MYILKFHFKNNIYEYFLPGVNNRKIKLDIDQNKSGYCTDFSVSLEVWNNEWVIVSNDEIRIKDSASKEYIDKIDIKKDIVINCELKETKEKVVIIVNENYSDYTSFDKYINNSAYIKIGSGIENDLQYNLQKLVTNQHAVIQRDSGGSIIHDKSSNGTFVNGKKINGSLKLYYGDVINIMGLKIVYLNEIIAINNPNKLVVSNKLSRYINNNENVNAIVETENFYRRSPRHIEFLDTETIEIEAPPTPNTNRRQPLVFIIGPAFTMVIPMTAGILFTMWSASRMENATMSPFMFMGIITSFTAAIIGVVWALANYKYTMKQEKLFEQKRTEFYKRYLEKRKQIIEDKHIENRALLLNKYPDTLESLRIVENNNRRLWERNINHIDFLTIRFGIGNILSPNSISTPKEKFTLIDDELAEQPSNIKNTYKELEDVPICISLKENNLIGVIGDNQYACNTIAKVLATQISTYHSYVDVKMCFIFDEKHRSDFYFAKWLPHCWDKDKSIRMIAYDKNGVKELFYHLSEVMRVRLEVNNNKNVESKLPHYIIFVSSNELIENHAILKYLYDTNLDIGFTIVLLYEHIGLLPNNCTVIIQNSEEFKGLYSLDNSFNEYRNVEFDIINDLQLIKFSKKLANIRTLENSGAGEIPKILTFLDMYKTSDINLLDIERRWLQNRTFESMKAIIGYKGADTPLFLDIHEKYHGPHGLVAGTTGSGKSETLQTYILSLALNYHPHEVSFILIDYKGGGMAVSFEKLPHTAGIITNLGGNQTNRALASINSEIKRRQEMLNNYKLKHIDGYIELFRENKVEQPMPHLIIIADEFAELKKEQPEFVRELVSASRVGRSLGVHLILATQKPSGVVDEEIWSNSKFKLCLRVQDKQDSNEMIKRPDAAYITNPGAGYFQVGNDEIFEQFQSGWSGAKYEPEIQFMDNKQNEVNMLNSLGKPLVITRTKKEIKNNEKEKITQLESVVLAVNKFAESKNIYAVSDIWLPPLPEKIYLNELKNYKTHDLGKKFSVVVGLIDDPKNQKQYTFDFDLSSHGNTLIIGTSGSGKTTFLQTILYSMVTKYTADEVNIYIADFGSRILGSFKKLPHVGDVLFSDENEKVEKLINLLSKELRDRKNVFSKKGIASIKEYSRIYNDIPNTVFVIDNYSAFIELCPKVEDKLVSLAMECASYGIYIIIINNSLSDIRYKLRQSFNNGIGLQLNDKYEYEEVLGAKSTIVAEDRIAGRGLVCYPNPLEFQVAMCFHCVDAIEFNEKLRNEFEIIAKNWHGKTALKLPEVPENVFLDNLTENKVFKELIYSSRYIPIAFDVEEAQIEKIDLERTYCYSISGDKKTGKTNLLKSIIKIAKQKNESVYIIDNNLRELASFANEVNSDGYYTTENEVFEFFKNILIPEFSRRNVNKAKYLKNDTQNISDYINSDRKIFIFINDITAFSEMVYTSEKDMKGFAEQMIEKGELHMIYIFANISNIDMIGTYNTKKLIRGFIGYKHGIHLGGKIDDQKVLDLEVSIGERGKRLQKGYGHLSNNGVTKKVKVIRI